MSQPDATVVDFAHFAALVRLNTDAAREWVKLNVSEERTMWCGGLVVEWRYLQSIIEGMRDAGLVVATPEVTRE